MNNCKQYLWVLIGIFVLLLSSHIFLLLLVDPLNISMFELSPNEFFIKEMRFQAGPIVNKIDFDSAIVGSSMAQNFKAKDANEKLGGKFQNLSPVGSLLKERKVILEHFFSQKKVKTLIVSLDGATHVQLNKGIPIDSWSFLYNESFIDDLSIYTNRKYFPYLSCHSWFNYELVYYLFGRCPRSMIREKVEDLTEWQSNPGNNSRFGGIENWIDHKNHDQIKRAINLIEEASRIIQTGGIYDANITETFSDSNEFSRNIIPFIKRFPETRFIFFFPPYSIFYFAITVQAKPYGYSQYKNFVEKIVLETESHSNAEVYWFNNEKFLTDISNYRDLKHYSAAFNTLFLDYFNARGSMINVRNYQSLLDDLEEKANNVDLAALARSFQ